MKEIKEKEFIKFEGSRIEKFLKYNYAGIETVTFIDTKVSPMGVPYIEGYVNGNKDMSFSADIYKEHFETALNSTGTIPLTTTDKVVESGFTPVSEIEKEEKVQSK
ncbi:DUF1433 domain-containing protein [Carnobacterium gallinarum]